MAAICAGGARRQDSVAAGLDAPGGGDGDVAAGQWEEVHDGARPCVGEDMLRRGLDGVLRWWAATAAAVKDTIKVVDGDGIITDTPGRAALWAAQTPWVFKRGLLRPAGGNIRTMRRWWPSPAIRCRFLRAATTILTGGFGRRGSGHRGAFAGDGAGDWRRRQRFFAGGLGGEPSLPASQIPAGAGMTTAVKPPNWKRYRRRGTGCFAVVCWGRCVGPG